MASSSRPPARTVDVLDDSPTLRRRPLRASSFNVRQQTTDTLRRIKQNTRKSTRGTFLHQSTLDTTPEHHPTPDEPASPGLGNMRFIDVVRVMLGKDGEHDSEDDGDYFRLKAQANAKARTEPLSTEELDGYESWRTFDKLASRLEDSLQKFSEQLLELGTSAGIVTSAHEVRHRIRQVTLLFALNAARLFPRSALDVASSYHYQKMRAMIRKYVKPKPSASHRQGVNGLAGDQVASDAEALSGDDRSRAPSLRDYEADRDPAVDRLPTLHSELAALSKDVASFAKSLEHFAEFTDRTGNYNLQYLESDLNFWAACLEGYAGDYDQPEVRSYIHDLSAELGQRFEETAETIMEFTEYIPSIRFYQKHRIDSLRNMATVSTFFSAVTASVIQFSWQTNDNALQQATNALWFSSLTFSIASAVSGSLAQMWRSAEYTSPTSSNWWMWIWVRQSPPIFLFISLANFLGGLGCFVMSTQKRGTQIVTLATEAISAIGISIIVIALIFRKWRYYLFKRRQRLRAQAKPATGFLSVAFAWADKPGATTIQFVGGVIPTYARHAAVRGGLHANRLGEVLACLIPTGWRDRHAGSVMPAATPRTATFEAPDIELTEPSLHRRYTSLDSGMGPKEKPFLPRVGTAASSFRGSAAPGMLRNISGGNASLRPPPSPLRPPNPEVRRRWRRVVRRVIDKMRREKKEEAKTMQELEAHAVGMREQKAEFVSVNPRAVGKGGGMGMELGTGTRSLQLSSQGAVATCDRKFTHHQDLREKYKGQRVRHTFPVQQVLWTADGGHLLTRTSKGIHIAESDGKWHKNVLRFTSGFLVSVRDPSEWSLLSFEGSRHAVNRLACMDLQGTVHRVHDFSGLSIHDADALPGGDRVVIVATRQRSESGHKPSRKAQTCRVLVVYNIKTASIDCEVPLKSKITKVKVSRDGTFAIVSSEDQPLQLWKLGPDITVPPPNDKVPPRFRITKEIQFQYIVPERAHFLGGDKFILGGGSDGKVRIWRRDREAPIRTFNVSLDASPDGPNKIPVLATNMDADEWMFLAMDARGVHVWRHRSRDGVEVNPGTNGGPAPLGPGREERPPSPAPVRDPPHRDNMLQLDIRGQEMPRSDSPTRVTGEGGEDDSQSGDLEGA